MTTRPNFCNYIFCFISFLICLINHVWWRRWQRSEFTPEPEWSGWGSWKPEWLQRSKWEKKENAWWGFSNHEDNSSSEMDIRKSKSNNEKNSSKGHKRSKRKRSSYSSASLSNSSSTSSSGSESSLDDDEEWSKPKSKKHETSNLDAMFHV